jgi:hypothetical protein
MTLALPFLMPESAQGQNNQLPLARKNHPQKMEIHVCDDQCTKETRDIHRDEHATHDYHAPISQSKTPQTVAEAFTDDWYPETDLLPNQTFFDSLDQIKINTYIVYDKTLLSLLPNGDADSLRLQDSLERNLQAIHAAFYNA